MGFCTIALTAVFIVINSLNLVRFFGFRHLCLKYITNSLAEYYNIYRLCLLGPLILERCYIELAVAYHHYSDWCRHVLEIC